MHDATNDPAGPFPTGAQDRPPDERCPETLSSVEIAAELEDLKQSLEAETARAAEARAASERVIREVERVKVGLRTRVRLLVSEQRRRMPEYDGLAGAAETEIEAKPTSRMMMPDAILAIWDLEDCRHPLNTDEIANGLRALGYRTSAAPRSLKSSINQTIARLCNAGRLKKYRSDGTPLANVEGARARRYLRQDLA